MNNKVRIIADYRDHQLKTFADDTDRLCDNIARVMPEKDVYALRAKLDSLCGDHKLDFLIFHSNGDFKFRQQAEKIDPEDFDPGMYDISTARVVRYQSPEWHWLNEGSFEDDPRNPAA